MGVGVGGGWVGGGGGGGGGSWGSMDPPPGQVKKRRFWSKKVGVNKDFFLLLPKFSRKTARGFSLKYTLVFPLGKFLNI